MPTVDDVNNSVTGQENVDDSVDYISALNEMKQNSVSRSEYEKLKADNKRLLDSIVNGTSENVDVWPKKSIEELRKNFMKEGVSNLDYWKNALELRERLIEEGQPDPMIPTGVRVAANQMDYDGVEKLVSGIQHCIDYANGDSQLFTNELQRITRDVNIPRQKR